MNHRWSKRLLAMIFLFPVFCPAQPLPDQSVIANVDSLIMGWRWQSSDGRSSIDVSSSGFMLFDGKLYDFELSGGALRFIGSGDSIPYLYDAVSERLTLELPDGPPTDYHRTIQSVLARRGTRRLPEKAEFLFGRFSTMERRSAENGLERMTINFRANTEFDFGPREYTNAGGAAGGADSSVALGTALVYEDAVIFSFYDSSAAEAKVMSRNSRGDIRSFTYVDEEYAREPWETTLLSSPEPYPVYEPVPGPPPPRPLPPYYPPYYPPIYYPPHYPPYYPPLVVSAPHPPPPEKGEKKGTERGSIGVSRGSGSSGSTSSRPSGGSSESSGGRSGTSGGTSRGGNRR